MQAIRNWFKRVGIFVSDWRFALVGLLASAALIYVGRRGQMWAWICIIAMPFIVTGIQVLWHRRQSRPSTLAEFCATCSRMLHRCGKGEEVYTIQTPVTVSLRPEEAVAMTTYWDETYDAIERGVLYRRIVVLDSDTVNAQVERTSQFVRQQVETAAEKERTHGEVSAAGLLHDCCIAVVVAGEPSDLLHANIDLHSTCTHDFGMAFMGIKGGNGDAAGIEFRMGFRVKDKRAAEKIRKDLYSVWDAIPQNQKLSLGDLLGDAMNRIGIMRVSTARDVVTVQECVVKDVRGLLDRLQIRLCPCSSLVSHPAEFARRAMERFPSFYEGLVRHTSQVT